MHTFLSALRALFVLGCLVIVPLMAVFGTTLPATLIAAISGQDAASAPAAAPKPAAPAIPANIAAPLPKTPLPSGSLGRPAANPALGGNENAAAIAQATLVSPAGNLPQFDAAPHVNNDPAANKASAVQPPVQPPSEAASLPVVPSRERFSSLETRLQQLGAKYYKLITAGDQNELFHFECQLPVAANAAPPRMFEATDADPIQAVARVVHQVEDFRSGHWQ